MDISKLFNNVKFVFQFTLEKIILYYSSSSLNVNVHLASYAMNYETEACGDKLSDLYSILF